MKIAVTIPVYLNVIKHEEFLLKTISSIYTTYPWIYIPVMNRDFTYGRKPYTFASQPEEVITLTGRQPQGVAKAWNDGIAEAVKQGCDYILILNQDIVLAKAGIDRIVDYAEQCHKEDDKIVLWSFQEHAPLETLDIQTGGADNLGPHFSAFMVDKRFPELLGKFDENFTPAYFEDNDLTTRLIKSGYKTVNYKHSKFFHYGSQTLKTDPDLQNGHNARFNLNERYFINKWGAGTQNTIDDILNRLYPTPFNDPTKKINDW